jgi:hypothetical protein
MIEIAKSLEALVDGAAHRLFDINEADSEIHPAPGKWSKKEIIGHLIDSAANNHQRFIRAQQEPGISLPGYAQNFWVERQSYQSEPWKTLVAFWTTYNTHLAHVIAQIPEGCESNLCAVGDNKPATLKWLAQDYVRHAQHHLDQIFGSNQ